MDKALLGQLVGLLARQSSGDATAIDRLRALDVRLDRGGCIFNLYQQWTGAFSYSPGRSEALPAILGLARELESFPSDDTLAMYELPQWSELVELRGPVEVVQVFRCPDCRRQYVSMGTSGFYDANGLVCPDCGNVYFKSYYDESPTPPCSCGGSFPARESYGCPSCGNPNGGVLKEISPFQYFDNHQYTRGPGA